MYLLIVIAKSPFSQPLFSAPSLLIPCPSPSLVPLSSYHPFPSCLSPAPLLYSYLPHLFCPSSHHPSPRLLTPRSPLAHPLSFSSHPVYPSSAPKIHSFLFKPSLPPHHSSPHPFLFYITFFSTFFTPSLSSYLTSMSCNTTTNILSKQSHFPPPLTNQPKSFSIHYNTPQSSSPFFLFRSPDTALPFSSAVPPIPLTPPSPHFPFYIL